MSDPNAGPDHIWQSAQAMIELGFESTPEVVVALRAIIDDDSVNTRARHGAAITLASLDPQHVPDAVAALRDIATSTPWPAWWRTVVLDLARLGDNVGPLARTHQPHHEAKIKDLDLTIYAVQKGCPRQDSNLRHTV